MMKIDLRIAKVWSDIPDVWKYYSKPRQLNYIAKSEDKGLTSLIGGFAGTDDLRPAITGIFFDKENIVTTDAHQLFILPNIGKLEGLYEIGSSKKIDFNFPSYRVVIPEESKYKYKINIEKLKTYCNVVVNGQYANTITKQVILKFGNKESISFNSKFLIEILTAFEKLGYVDIYIGIERSTRGAIFSVEEKDLFKSSSAYGKRPLALLMPLMMNDELEYAKIGAVDIDYLRELQVLYDLSTDTIIDANGKEVSDWQPKTDWGLPYWDIEEARVFTKIINSKTSKSIPVLEMVKIQNKKIVATNLSLTYCLNDADVEDGLYEIVNLALVDTPDYKIEDYPLDVWVNNEFKENEKFNLNIGSIIEASKFVGDDELREVMMGVHIETGKGITKVQSTDAHLLFSVQSQTNGLKYDTNQILGSIDFLVPCLKTFSSIYPNYGVSATQSYSYLRDLRHQIYVKNIDAKYPDFNPVLPSKVEGSLNFDAEQLFRFLKDLKLKGKDAKIHFKVSGNDVTVSSYNEGVLSKVGVIKGSINEKPNYSKPDCYVGLMQYKANDIDTGVLFDYNKFKSFIGTAYKYGKKDGDILPLYFDSKGLYLCEIDNLDFSANIGWEKKKETAHTISKKPIKAKEITEKPTKNEDKAQIMATINALKYIDDEDAKKTIKALKILLQNM